MQSPLDCDTFASALETVAALLATTPDELRARLGRFDHEAPPRQDERQPLPLDERILTYGLGITEDPLPSMIYWFHATRTWRDAFTEGILPVDRIEPELWDRLGRLASGWSTSREWEEFRRNIWTLRSHPAGQYQSRRSLGGGGPYAYLVRDMIFRTHDEPAHFLSAPETVADICGAYEAETGHPLLHRFMGATAPCIVKFRSLKPSPGVVCPAVMYLYSEIHRLGHGVDSNTCFNGHGVAVPVADIIRVEWDPHGS